MSDNDEWIRPRTLANLLNKHRSEFNVLEGALRTPLAHGRITARTASVEIDWGAPTRKKETREDWPIEPKAWEGSAEDSYFNLAHDVFNARVRGLGYDYIRCSGLSFNLRQVMDVFEIESADDEPALLDLTDFVETRTDEIASTTMACSAAAWWAFPEVMAWIIRPDIDYVGRVKVWLDYRIREGSSGWSELSRNIPSWRTI